MLTNSGDGLSVLATFGRNSLPGGFGAFVHDSIEATWASWNQLHADLFTIQEYGEPGDDLPRMVEEFMKMKEKALGFTEAIDNIE